MKRVISIINAGGQTDYLFGLVSGLAKTDSLIIEVIDSNKARDLFNDFDNVIFLNLRGDQNPQVSFFEKAVRILRYYFRLFRYVVQTKSKIFHIQWENKFLFFDRTILLLFYKLLGKRIVLTAHNIDETRRGLKLNFLHYFIYHFSLQSRYYLVDHIIVHTEEMKNELIQSFRIPSPKISVITHGINNLVPRNGVSREISRARLNILLKAKLLLVFGGIDPYKGVDLAIYSLRRLLDSDSSYYLLIAGRHKNYPEYVELLHSISEKLHIKSRVIFHTFFIPDNQVQYYFEAADCTILPYKNIFQSGVLFLSLRFGLPIIATDVGGFREAIIDGKNGFICKPNDPSDLGAKIEDYFHSSLYKNLHEERKRISQEAECKYSWLKIGKKTVEIYKRFYRE